MALISQTAQSGVNVLQSHLRHKFISALAYIYVWCIHLLVSNYILKYMLAYIKILSLQI